MDNDIGALSYAREVECNTRMQEADLDGGLGIDVDYAQRSAAEEVQRLVDKLELTLDARERRLLHQLRLAAESLGAVQTASPLWRRQR